MARVDRTNEYVLNIRRVLDMATMDHRKRGKSWYLTARVAAWQISQESGVPLMNVCAVMAALSPRNKWARNVLDTQTMCRLKDQFEMGKYGTFNTNRDKAYALLWAKDKASCLTLLKGQKVTAFFENIYDPSSHRVTVDVHMQMVAIGRYLPENERPALTDKMYREIESAIKKVAIDNGMMPYELQATAWLTWKEGTKNVY